MSFNAIRENKILAKISESTVLLSLFKALRVCVLTNIFQQEYGVNVHHVDVDITP